MTTDKHIHSTQDTLSPGGSFVCAGPSGRVVAPSLSPPADPARRLAWLAEHYWDKSTGTTSVGSPETLGPGRGVHVLGDLLGRISETDAARPLRGSAAQGRFPPDIQPLLLDAAGYFWQHPGSMFRNEKLLIPMLEAAIAAPGIGDIHKAHLRARLASALRNRPGTRAADFTYTTGNGSHGTLHGFRAGYTLLMFYNPGCPECGRIEEYIPEPRRSSHP